MFNDLVCYPRQSTGKKNLSFTSFFLHFSFPIVFCISFMSSVLNNCSSILCHFCCFTIMPIAPVAPLVKKNAVDSVRFLLTLTRDEPFAVAVHRVISWAVCNVAWWSSQNLPMTFTISCPTSRCQKEQQQEKARPGTHPLLLHVTKVNSRRWRSLFLCQTTSN